MENITINISLPKPLLDGADKQAETELRNRSELIREAIRNYLIDKSTGSDLIYTNEENIRIEALAKIKPLTDKVSLQLSAVFRPQPNIVPDLFKGGDSLLKKLIENPPSFRRGGWDLQTLDIAKPIAGAYLQLNNGDRKALRFYRDGQFLFALDYDFLGHGVNSGTEGNEFSINGLAAAESITNFVYFIHEYKEFLSRPAGIAIVKIKLLNPKGVKMNLIGVRGNNNFNSRLGNAVELGSLEGQVQIDLTKGVDKDVAAYKMLAEFFYFFGIMDFDFLYVNREKGAVDISSFKKG
ncbi:MAG: ribbon-helix-helix domain-containing protein [Patescibacteria group bacterium]